MSPTDNNENERPENKNSPPAKTKRIPQQKHQQQRTPDPHDSSLEFLKRLESKKNLQNHNRQPLFSLSALADALREDQQPLKICTSGPPMGEITIDPNAVPPSPMRNPTLRKPLPNLLASEEEEDQIEDFLHTTTRLGDPVGDIGMKTQLWDAQRLVRIILGKSHKASEAPLETGSILQAIRCFALMKAELEEIRQKSNQNVKNNNQEPEDPPTILALPSPSTTCTSFFGDSPGKPQSDIHRRAIIQAAKKIQSLEEKLQENEVLVNHFQTENLQLNDKLKQNNERLSRYRQEATKAMQTKDARLAKYERSIAQLSQDVSQVIQNLQNSNNKHNLQDTVDQLQQSLATATSPLLLLKSPKTTGSTSSRLQKLYDEHSALVESIQTIEDEMKRSR
jgi:hypothetical protein